MKEIERKFLFTGNTADIPYKDMYFIDQAYICPSPEVRIRRSWGVEKGWEYFLTVKGPGTLVREEFEVPIEPSTYAVLRDKCDYSVSKARMTVNVQSYYDAVVDIYYGPGENKVEVLSVIEIEFPSEAMAHSFQPPEWFGSEVTGNSEFKAINIARRLNQKLGPVRAI